jgi:type VI secretion system secreted protein VgrG
MEQLIQHDSRIEIGNERLETIKGNSVSVLKADQNVTVTGARKVKLLADDHLDIAGSSHTRVGGDVLVAAGQEVHLSGEHIVIDGGISLSLSVNGQHLVLNPAGIFSSSLILPGSAPVPGTPANPLAPGNAAPLKAGEIEVGPENQTIRPSTMANSPSSPAASTTKTSSNKPRNKNLYSN